MYPNNIKYIILGEKFKNDNILIFPAPRRDSNKNDWNKINPTRKKFCLNKKAIFTSKIVSEKKENR